LIFHGDGSLVAALPWFGLSRYIWGALEIVKPRWGFRFLVGVTQGAPFDKLRSTLGFGVEHLRCSPQLRFLTLSPCIPNPASSGRLRFRLAKDIFPDED
jgi:hypothetical protein